MRDFLESSGGLAVALIAGAIAAGPVLGWWPLVGIIAACGTAIYIANIFRHH
jgi:hypothetical protein